MNRDNIETLPEQVATAIAKLLDSGSLAPDTRLDPVALAQQFGVSRRTVTRAFTLLRQQGRVTILHSRGAYVVGPCHPSLGSLGEGQ